MRILYLSLSYLPSRRASSVQIMRMCAALARAGHDVHLIAKAGDEVVDDIHAYFDVPPSFSITALPRPKRRGGGVVYAAAMLAELVRRRGWAQLAYCRDPIATMMAARLGIPFVFEAHDVPDGWLARGLRSVLGRDNARGLVAISSALAHDLDEAGLRVRGRPTLVAHDGCDAPAVRCEPRSPRTPPVIGYVGGLYPGRGIELIVDLARRMPAYQFRVVGGTDADVDAWRARASLPNLVFAGFVRQRDLPAEYARFDVVLMPYSARGVVGPTRSKDTSRWASPMKMFEYMASGVPIVASDLPVLHEVLRDGHNAVLVPPDDAVAWQAAIEAMLARADRGHALAAAAQTDLIASYTWDARAASVLAHLAATTVS